MKKLIIALALLVSTGAYAGGEPPAAVKGKNTSVAPIVVKNDEYYVSLKGGLNLPFNSNFDGGNVDFDNGFAVNAAFGKHFTKNIRGEIELGYASNDFDGVVGTYCPVEFNGKLYTYSVFTNTYYDIGTYAGFTPYVGAGLGVVQQHAEVDIFGASDANLAYQGILGVSYPIANRVSLTGEYRYVGEQDPSFAGVDAEYKSQQALVGLRFEL